VSHRIGAPLLSAEVALAPKPDEAFHVGDEIDHPARVDHPHDGSLENRIEPVEVRLGADHRKRATVDLCPIPEVTHRARSCAPASSSSASETL